MRKPTQQLSPAKTEEVQKNDIKDARDETDHFSNVRPLRKRKQISYRDTIRPIPTTKLEIVCSPAPVDVRSILSATQRSAKQISKKAKVYKRTEKNVTFATEPTKVVDITPRSEKQAGVINMPESPPFPYSRTTFFNLLVRHDIVSDGHPMRNEYIKGDAELNDLGVPSGKCVCY
ncbi:unnamed protein product [Enterobius vermicularis]|uniref:PPP1R35_C domain-containing protein n=1 Tax=Enterobius vermicularis TaxID=51028 RepID=A0A0N4VM05_ENTVE|nr:unnamed protein product [Enterobius vermicularis]